MSIILKRGLESNRASTSVAEGEILFSKDTGRVYVGSGSGNLGGQEIKFFQLTASHISATDVTASNIKVTGTIQGTSSWAQTATTLIGSVESASYAFTASYLLGSIESASYALHSDTASYLLGSIASASYALNSDTASYLVLAKTASYVTTAQTASYVVLAKTASYVETAQTASTVAWNGISGKPVVVSSSAQFTQSDTFDIGQVSSSGILIQNTENISRITLLANGTVPAANSIFAARVGAGTLAAPSSTLQGHYTAWQMQTYGGSIWSTVARMQMQAAGDHNEGSRPTNITFATVVSGSSTLSDRFKINGVGVQVTGSIGVTADANIVGSVTASGILSNLTGTSSWANFAVTASYVSGQSPTASYALTASYVVNSISSSFATTASYVTGQSPTSSYAISSSYALTASYVTGQSPTSSYALTASYVETAKTASFFSGNFISASIISASEFYVDTMTINATTMSVSTLNVSVIMNGTASIARTASYVAWSSVAGSSTDLFLGTSSYALNISSSTTSTFNGTSSFATTARTASFVANAQTASFLTTTNNYTVGQLSATGVTASLVGTSSWASNARTASFVANAQTASFLTTTNNYTVGQLSATGVTASLVGTSSWSTNARTASYVLASFVSASVISASNFWTQFLVVTGSAAVTGAFAVLGTIQDTYGNVRAVPQNIRTAAYTLTSTDIGRHVFTTASVTVSASVFSVGDVSMIVNSGSGNISIITGSGITFRLAGTTSGGNRTLANYGSATVMCVAPDLFYLSGAGIT